MSPRSRCKNEIGKVAQRNEVGKWKQKAQGQTEFHVYKCRSRSGSRGCYRKIGRGINLDVPLPDLRTTGVLMKCRST